MLRLLFIALLALLIIVPNCSGGDEGAGEDGSALTGALAGRSLVLVVADSLHATHLGTYGSARDTSPFIDRLAGRGVRVDRALSQTSWTLSSITSLFTGLAQERHGVLRLQERLAEDGPTTLAELFRRKGYRTVGLVQNAVVGEESGLGRGFDRYTYHRFTHEGGEELVNDAARELAADDGPLFLYVHFGPPHMPYQPPEPFLSRFLGDAESAITGSINDTATITRDKLAPTHPDVRRLVELYDGHIAYFDDLLQRMVEPALSSPEGVGPAVLVTSDHGEAFMQHGAVGHNYFVYEPMVRVPWILVAPGAVPEGVVLPGPTSLLDTLPTLADLFDLPLPGSRLDGRSLAASFERPEPVEDRALHLSSRYGKEAGNEQLALVEGRWKLVVGKRDTPGLFDITEDPEEQFDLADRDPERVAEMLARLEEQRAAAADANATAGEASMSDARKRDLEALGYGGEAFESVEDR
ncbi:MAG: sulfatase [Planctomycetota bacterium]